MTSTDTFPRTSDRADPCGPMPGATTRSSWPPAARPSPRRVGSASLEEIARRAGVGIGTLYRHFPTRPACSRPSTWRRSRPCADGRRARWGSHRGRRWWPGCTASSTTWPPSRPWPRSCSPRSAATPTCSWDAHGVLRRPARRCWCGPRRPALVRTDTDIADVVMHGGRNRQDAVGLPRPDLAGSSTWPSTDCAASRCAAG